MPLLCTKMCMCLVHMLIVRSLSHLEESCICKYYVDTDCIGYNVEIEMGGLKVEKIFLQLRTLELSIVKAGIAKQDQVLTV